MNVLLFMLDFNLSYHKFMYHKSFFFFLTKAGLVHKYIVDVTCFLYK